MSLVAKIINLKYDESLMGLDPRRGIFMFKKDENNINFVNNNNIKNFSSYNTYYLQKFINDEHLQNISWAIFVKYDSYKNNIIGTLEDIWESSNWD